MVVHDELGKRMKEYYEQIPKIKLMRRCPVVCRIDGKAFHSYTRGFRKPFDDLLIKSMQDTMKYLCENIQGCKLGYCQSDEISLLLIDYERLESQAFFDYEVQKMCSVIASMATMVFNKIFAGRVANIDPMLLGCYNDAPDNSYEIAESYGFNPMTKEGMDDLENQIKIYRKAIQKGATFDCRVFNIQSMDVVNYFYWRQLDATRNSIQMVGQANFSHKELQNKSCNDIQDILHEQKGINWNDFPIYQKRGSCCIKIKQLVNDIERSKWIVDNEIPIFVNEGRDYIEQRF